MKIDEVSADEHDVFWNSKFKVSIKFQASSFKFSSRAFSLIEMIGVMAIMAILALALASVTTKSLDQAVSSQESALLANFATSLQNSIVRNGYIPGTTDWYQAIATEMGADTNMVRLTARKAARVFMIDPNLQIGTNSTGV